MKQIYIGLIVPDDMTDAAAHAFVTDAIRSHRQELTTQVGHSALHGDIEHARKAQAMLKKAEEIAVLVPMEPGS